MVRRQLSMPQRLLLLFLLETCTAARNTSAPEALTEEQKDWRILPDNYYTLHQDHNHVTLKVKMDGTLEWDEGFPTLYSVLREQVVRSSQVFGESSSSSGSDEDRMYTLEATATQHWICMRGKGRLYTVHQPQYYKEEKRKLQRIRHEAQKRSTKRWAVPPSSLAISPPGDCLFKTYEFNPNESYERSVAIYSFSHSNSTHGRFLAINKPNGKVRTYRRSFSQLNTSNNLKISQVPIRFLSDMISVTKFARGREYNARVRGCIVTLFQCPNHQQKIARDKKSKRQREGQETHFYRIIERCKRRAQRTDKVPAKCSKKSGGGVKRRLLRRSQRKNRRRRRKSVRQP